MVAKTDVEPDLPSEDKIPVPNDENGTINLRNTNENFLAAKDAVLYYR